MPDKDPTNWAIILAVGGQLFTWLGGALAFMLGFGKLQQKVNTNEKAIAKMDGRINTPDHHARILTSDEHEAICNKNQKTVHIKLDNICVKLEDSKRLDQEIFGRLRMIEDSNLLITTQLSKEGR